MLVEEVKISSVVRRLFTNKVVEILGEILQNSQRAKADKIEFTVGADQTLVVITDNGNGLSEAKGTPDQFLSLVTVAGSFYSDKTVSQDQKPMGIGFFSLLANQSVKRVEIHSNGLCLNLPVESVWEEPTFWQNNNWQKNITASSFKKGFKIVVSCDSVFAEEMVKELKEQGSLYKSPVTRGYAEYFRLFLNNEEIIIKPFDRTELFSKVLIETTFEGAELLIGLPTASYGFETSALVNWFGQLIKLTLPNQLAFYLNVKSGTPLTPKSPTRQGFVNDDKYLSLTSHITTLLREFVLDQNNRQHITKALLNKLYQHDSKWMRENCPYFVGAKLERAALPDSYEDFELFTEEVLAYADQDLVINPGLTVLIGEEEYELEHGISTFAGTLNKYAQEQGFGNCYIFRTGNSSKANPCQLYWRIGEPNEPKIDFFYDKGSFALASEADEIGKLNWIPISEKENVYGFEYCENWHIGSIENLFVGVENNLKAKNQFISNEVWDAWSGENDEASYDEMREEFKNSITHYQQLLMQDSINEESINLYQIGQQCKLEEGETITNIKILADGVEITTSAERIITKVWLNNCLEKINI